MGGLVLVLNGRRVVITQFQRKEYSLQSEMALSW